MWFQHHQLGSAINRAAAAVNQRLHQHHSMVSQAESLRDPAAVTVHARIRRVITVHQVDTSEEGGEVTSNTAVQYSRVVSVRLLLEGGSGAGAGAGAGATTPPTTLTPTLTSPLPCWRSNM
jgi:hypothetical protein